MSLSASLGRFTANWARLPGNLRGVLWIFFGTLAFALNDVVIKKLGRRIDVVELAFARYAVGMLILSPVFLRMGWSGLRTERLWLHISRLVLGTLAQLGAYISVIHLYLADATAIAFSRPLFTTVVAVLVLGETVNMRRWAATAIGFAGVLIMVRPGSNGIDPIAVVAVVSALTFAVGNVLIRMLSTTEPPNRILFYYHFGGTIIFVGPAIARWQTPVGSDWLLLLAIGALATLAMIGFVRGFAAGEANAVGPIEYVRLIYAALFGYFLFAEVPSLWTFAGATVIVAATLYIARGEARRPAAREGPAGD